MRVALLCLAIMAGLTQSAPAAIVFSVAQSAPGPIVLGNSVNFTVSVASDSGPINNFFAATFFANANDPGKTGTQTAGGRITSAVLNFVPGAVFFVGPTPSSSVVFDYNATPGGVALNAATPFLTFTLSTAGATVGNYNLTLSDLAAADPGFNNIPIVAPAPFAYSIVSAVPEPSSILLTLGAVGIGGRWLRRRKK